MEDLDKWNTMHKVATYASDGVLVTALTLWAAVPEIRDVLGLLGALGAFVIAGLRIWQGYMDVQASRLRLQRLRANDNIVDRDTGME